MSYEITSDCLACGVCADECPVGCISEAGDTYTIDKDSCTECGTCLDSCPNDAIIER